AVSAADPDFLASEERGLAVVVHAPAIDICAIDGREDPGVAAFDEDIYDGSGVLHVDVARLLDRTALAVARHDAERLRTCWQRVARDERAIGVDAHRRVVDLKARDAAVDVSAH